VDRPVARARRAVFLAAHQADAAVDVLDEAEQARCCTKARKGEMAALGEVPFARYFGGVDQTPLFVMLGGRVMRSAPATSPSSIAVALARPRRWAGSTARASTACSPTAAGAATGLANQGWEDSVASVFHADGLDGARVPDRARRGARATCTRACGAMVGCSRSSARRPGVEARNALGRTRRAASATRVEAQF
jgi:hypothetical protein